GPVERSVGAGLAAGDEFNEALHWAAKHYSALESQPSAYSGQGMAPYGRQEFWSRSSQRVGLKVTHGNSTGRLGSGTPGQAATKSALPGVACTHLGALISA